MKKRYHKIADFFKAKSKKFTNGFTGVAYIKKSYAEDILYITTEGIEVSNKTKLVTRNEELFDNRTLVEFTKQYDFFQRIGKSLVVNTKLVDKLSEGLNYIWVGTIKLHVSRKYKEELKQKLEQYL